MTETIELPAGPTDSKIKQALSLGKDLPGYLEQCADQYGDAFTLNLPGLPPMIWVNDPESTKSFFELPPDAYDHEQVNLAADVGDNTLFLNGDAHQEARRMVMPPLAGSRLKERAEVMHDIVTEYIDLWKPGMQLDMLQVVTDITLDIACYTLLGLRSGEKRDKYKRLMLAWLNESSKSKMQLFSSLFGGINFRRKLNKAYRKKMDTGDFGHGKKGFLPWTYSAELKAQLADFILQDIRRVRAAKNPDGTDMLSIMALTKYETGELLSEERVISESLGILIAGHETSAATAAWYMLWLLKHPHIYQKMHDEVVQSVQAVGKFDPLEIVKLPYSNACLSESQRLTPSAVGTMRHLVKETKLGDRVYPPNVNILAAAHLTHRREDIWGEDVLEYRPERWLEGRKMKSYEYFPFGGGRRMCIGFKQAKQQLRIIFAELARRVDFESDFSEMDKWPDKTSVVGQVVPIGGVPVTVTKVRPS